MIRNAYFKINYKQTQGHLLYPRQRYALLCIDDRGGRRGLCRNMTPPATAAPGPRLAGAVRRRQCAPRQRGVRNDEGSHYACSRVIFITHAPACHYACDHACSRPASHWDRPLGDIRRYQSRMTAPPSCTARLDLSGPPSRKILAFSSRALQKWSR